MRNELNESLKYADVVARMLAELDAPVDVRPPNLIDDDADELAIEEPEEAFIGSIVELKPEVRFNAQA